VSGRAGSRLVSLLGDGPVGLDTCVFIYFVEEHPRYLPLIEPVFERVDSGRLRVFSSALTLLETLVVPFRAGNAALAEKYEHLLTSSRGLTLVDVDRAQLRAAAQLRARTGMRAPDALQVAAALGNNCARLVTNDRRLPPVPGLTVVQLSDFV